MKDKLVTLIGGGGFLGRYVTQELLRRGARVRVAVPRPRDAFFLKPQGGLGQTQLVAADITRPETLARAVAGSDAVVNLVGTFAAGAYRKLHVEGARNAAEAAKATGAASFVQVSALGADAESDSGYARSKAAGEAAVLAAFPTATILRPATLFGREDAFVNRFAAMIAGNPVVPVLGSTTRFQPLWVADAAEAVAVTAGDPEAHGAKTYMLGGPDVLTMLELNQWIAGEIGVKRGFVPLDPFGGLIAMLPFAPITGDQWRMLKVDNVVPAGAKGMHALGIVPKPLAAVAPAWLVRYRRNGRFGKAAA
jgi:uncharacterized protein YbjT (DUF2867 family)